MVRPAVRTAVSRPSFRLYPLPLGEGPLGPFLLCESSALRSVTHRRRGGGSFVSCLFALGVGS